MGRTGSGEDARPSRCCVRPRKPGSARGVTARAAAPGCDPACCAGVFAGATVDAEGPTLPASPRECRRRAHGELRLRRRDHRLGLRRERRRAPCRGEGLPRRRDGVRPALARRGHPKTQWDLRHFLWFPAGELYGIQRIEYLDDVLILRGAGVGGGSHVYANTLYVPPKQFFAASEWAGITDWA